MKKKLLLAFGFLTLISGFAQTINPAPYCAAGFKNVPPFDLPDRLITNVSFGTLSNNSGNTWATSSVSFTTNGSFTDIANSISGKYVYTPFLPSSYPIGAGNEIYYSTDNGSTFSNKITVSGITGSYISLIKTNK
jgi:hypothetical protein